MAYRTPKAAHVAVLDMATADLATHVAKGAVSNEDLVRIARGDVRTAKDRKVAEAIELGRRALLLCERDGLLLGCEAHVASWARGQLGGIQHEELWALAMNARNRLISAHMISSGGAAGTCTTAADILRVMLRAGARGFILVHNHPSGDPLPSRDDIAMTAQVKEASEIVGITLHDHVIVGGGRSYSLQANGLMRGGGGLLRLAAVAVGRGPCRRDQRGGLGTLGP